MREVGHLLYDSDITPAGSHLAYLVLDHSNTARKLILCCCDIAFNDLERPIITLVQVFGTHLCYWGGVT